MAKRAPVRRGKVMSARKPSKAGAPAASNERIAPTMTRAAVPKTKLVPGTKVTVRQTAVRPPFQLPFKCGQTWRASTYDGHYPDQDSLDRLVLPTAGILERARALHVTNSVSFWDATILAACIEAGVDVLYSEDVPGLDTIAGVEVVNPFK